jgi:hypothetical protein
LGAGGIEKDRAENQDYVVLEPQSNSFEQPQDALGWRNPVTEGDIRDALRVLRLRMPVGYAAS